MISVLIPCYNRVNFLSQTLDSVINQTESDWECVISDNASSDGSWEIALDYSRRDSRIKAIRNSKNLGPVENWLIGLKACRSEWVKILFSDDLMAPDCVEIISNNLSCPDIGLIYFNFRNTPGKLPGRFRVSAFLLRAFLPGRSISCSPSAYAVRRSAAIEALKTRFSDDDDDNYKRSGVGYDFQIVAMSALTGKFVRCIPTQKVFFTQHDGCLTASIGNLREVTESYSRAYACIIRHLNLSRLEKLAMVIAVTFRGRYYRLRLRRFGKQKHES